MAAAGEGRGSEEIVYGFRFIDAISLPRPIPVGFEFHFENRRGDQIVEEPSGNDVDF